MNSLFDTLMNKYPARQQDKDAYNELSAGTAAAQPSPPAAKISTAKLVSLWQNDQGNKEYTSELLKRMQPTIKSAMTSYAPGMDDKLAVKAAKLALNALSTYSPSYGTEPSTHVFHNLKRLSRYGAKMSSIVPRSESIAFDLKKISDATERFVDRHDREPSDAELADLTGLSIKRINKVRETDTSVVSESSTLTDDTQRDTYSKSELTDKDYYGYVYASVDPIEQKIMEWTTGMNGGTVLSNNQIASKLHMSPAAVSQRKNKIQQKMSDIRSLL